MVVTGGTSAVYPCYVFPEHHCISCKKIRVRGEDITVGGFGPQITSKSHGEHKEEVSHL